MQLEQSTIDSYNEASRIASEHKDAVTHKMFQDIIAEEEQHLDTFRTELQNLLDYGEEYLALQSAAGSKHDVEELRTPRRRRIVGPCGGSRLRDGCLPGRGFRFLDRICVSDPFCGTGASPGFGEGFSVPAGGRSADAAGGSASAIKSGKTVAMSHIFLYLYV